MALRKFWQHDEPEVSAEEAEIAARTAVIKTSAEPLQVGDYAVMLINGIAEVVYVERVDWMGWAQVEILSGSRIGRWMEERAWHLVKLADAEAPAMHR